MGSILQYLDEEIRFQSARWSTRVAVYYLYQRYNHGARPTWVGNTDYPDFLPVSEVPRSSSRYLTVCALGTSLCSSSTRRTPFTSVSRHM